MGGRVNPQSPDEEKQKGVSHRLERMADIGELMGARESFAECAVPLAQL